MLKKADDDSYYEDDYKKGRGYVGRSMSVNAADAYEEGRKPISRVTKEDISAHGIKSLSMFKWFLMKHCESCERHHTSPEYNITDFYDIAYCCEKFNNFDMKALNKEYAEYNKQKRECNVEREQEYQESGFYYAKVKYSIRNFKGARQHYEEYAIIYRGWAHLAPDNKKSIEGNHFDIIKEYKRRPKEMPKETASAILSKLKLK